jgi:hypothetical protein
MNAGDIVDYYYSGERDLYNPVRASRNFVQAGEQLSIAVPQDDGGGKPGQYYFRAILRRGAEDCIGKEDRTEVCRLDECGEEVRMPFESKSNVFENGIMIKGGGCR